jgi:hypothetical protein
MELPRVPGRTTPAFGFSYVERSLKDCLRERRFGADEKQEVVRFFEQWESQPECAYCGSTDVRRWDHVVPVMSGGAAVLGNMVLACSSCDDSKAQRVFDEWMLGSTLKSPSSRGVSNVSDRIARIRAYAEQHGYESAQVEAGLNRAERERLRSVRDQLALLRQEVESLVNDFRARTGYR